MRKKVIERLEDEYITNTEKIYELEKEIDALGKKRLLSKFCTVALFGIIPTLLLAFATSRFVVYGTLGIGTATAISTLSSIGVSLINYALYSKKFKFKEQFEEYNVKGTERELLEREYDLVEDKKILEIENQAILKYHSKLVNKQLTLENTGLSEETIEKELEEKHKKLTDASRLIYMGECFLDFENNKRSVLKSFVFGMLCGMVTSGVILYLPTMMAGIIPTTTFQLLPNMLMTLTGICFGTYSAKNTKNIERIYKRKKEEMKQIDFPKGTEQALVKAYGLLHEVTKEYVTAMKNKDSLELPRKEIEIVLDPKEQTLIPTQEKVVKLEKKY